MRWIIYNSATGQFGVTSDPSTYQGNPNIVLVGPEDAATKTDAASGQRVVDYAYITDKIKLDTAMRMREMDINQYQAETQRMNTYYSNQNAMANTDIAAYNAQTSRMGTVGNFALESGRPENWAFYANNAIGGKGSALKFLSNLSGAGRGLPGVVQRSSLNPLTPKEFMNGLGVGGVGSGGGGGGGGSGGGSAGSGNGVAWGRDGYESRDYQGSSYYNHDPNDPEAIGSPWRNLESQGRDPIGPNGEQTKFPGWDSSGQPRYPNGYNGQKYPRAPKNATEQQQLQAYFDGGPWPAYATAEGDQPGNIGQGDFDPETGLATNSGVAATGDQAAGQQAGGQFATTRNPGDYTNQVTQNADGTLTERYTNPQTGQSGTRVWQSREAMDAALYGPSQQAGVAAGSPEDLALQGQPVPPTNVVGTDQQGNMQYQTKNYDPATKTFSRTDAGGRNYQINESGSGTYTDSSGRVQHYSGSTGGHDTSSGKYDNPDHDVDDDPEDAMGGAHLVDKLGPGAHAEIVKHPRKIPMGGESVQTGEPDADNPDGADELHIVVPLQGNKPVSPFAARLANEATAGNPYRPTDVPPNVMSQMAQRSGRGMAGGGISLPNTGPHYPPSQVPEQPIYVGPESTYMPLVPEQPTFNDQQMSPRARAQQGIIQLIQEAGPDAVGIYGGAQQPPQRGMAEGGAGIDMRDYPEQDIVPGGGTMQFDPNVQLDPSQVDDQRTQAHGSGGHPPPCFEDESMFTDPQGTQYCAPMDNLSMPPGQCPEGQVFDPGTQRCFPEGQDQYLPGMAEGGIAYGDSEYGVLSPGASLDIGNKPYDAMKESGLNARKNPYDALIAPKEPMYINKAGQTQVITGGAGKTDRKTGVYTPKYKQISAAQNSPYYDALSLPATQAEDLMRTPLQRAMYESIMKEIGEDPESYWARFAYALPGGNVPAYGVRRRGFG